MYDTDADDGRTADESSPSTGWREIADRMHAPRAHAVEPAPEDRDTLDLEADDMIRRDIPPTPEVAP